MLGLMTLTLDLSDLRGTSDRALEQLSSAVGERFDQELSEIQNFLALALPLRGAGRKAGTRN